MSRGYFKKRISLFFLISFITGFHSVVFSQDYSYVNYDVKDGLAGSTVYCMVQDRDGFIWIGTETGLSRFDGTHFKNFSTADGLPDNEIVKLFVDSKNRVWIVPFRNSLCYYLNGQIHTAENDSLLKMIKPESELISIFENSLGDLLIQEVNAAHIIDHSGALYTIDKLAGRPIRVLKTGLNKNNDFRLALVFTSGYNLVMADIQNKGLSVVQDIQSAAQNNYGSIFFNPHLEIYAKNNFLRFIYTNDDSEFEFPLSEGFINASAINDTTFAFNYGDKTLLFDVTHKKIIDSFSVGQPINTVIQDSEGSLWFSTMGKGVYRLASSDFENYSFKTNGIPSSVFCVKKFDSIIYVGTANFFAWSLNHSLSVIKHKQLKHGFTRGRIITINKTSAQRFIIGTDNGLFAFDNWRIKSFFTGVAVKDVFLDTDGKIIVSTSRNVLHIDPVKLKLIDAIWGERSTCAYKLNDTNYVGTLNGLYAVAKNGKFYFVGDSDELLKKRIAAIGASRNGTLWIATSGNGLLAYRSGKVIRSFTTRDGLTSDICRNIFISSKDVWTGTDKGLNKISMVDTGYTITTFTTGDGLKSDIINAIYVDGSEVLLGTPEGLTRFDINKKAKNSSCKLYITDIVAAGKQMPHNQTDFILPPKDNNIRIDFVGISYKSAGDIIYKYKLSIDTVWRTTNATSLNYPSLSSGSYNLELTAINKFGVESNHVIIRFTIEKLLREKLWFQAIMSFVVIGVVSFFVYLRFKNLKQKEAQKLMLAVKMGELEQMALRSQMNPHFIFNSLNSIQQYVMDKDILGANEFITHFSRLIRLTLDISSKLDISLEQEIIYLSTYLDLEKKRFENKFSYDIILDDNVNREDYFIPPMILQPYVENSIRHGMRYKKEADGKILIKFCRDSKYLTCSIEDNGIGRKLALQYKSIVPVEYQSKGMTLTAKRIELFNKTHGASVFVNIEDLDDQQQQPIGTKITIHFPLLEVYRPNSRS